jgi:hypothetical protein
MSQPIQRDGVWWHQKADGTWLRWNAQKSEWETAPAAPPPPAPPGESGPAAAVPSDPVDQSREPAFGFSTADPDAPSTTALPEGSEEVTWDFGDESVDPVNFGPANADVLPPESDKPTATDWLNDNRAIAAVAALVLLAAAVFAAFTFFGGGDDTTDAGTADTAIGTVSPNKVVVRKLNSLCKSAKREIKALGTPTTSDDLVTYMSGVKRAYNGFFQKLDGIKPKPEIEADFARLVKDFKKQSNWADDMFAAAQSGNIIAAQQRMQQLEAESTKMNARARSFGAHACASTSA